MIALTLVFLICAGVALGDVVTPCPNTQQSYDSVKIFVGETECTTSPCRFARGKNVTAEISWTTQQAITKISQYVNATALGVTIPFPLPDADKGCDHLGEDYYCPLEAGETPIFELIMPVLSSYPLVGLDLVFYLEDQIPAQIVCFALKAQVVNA